MSNTSKLEATLDTTWRAATDVSHVAVDRAASTERIKPSGAIFYTQPSGADLFPSVETIKAFFRKLRRA